MLQKTFPLFLILLTKLEKHSDAFTTIEKTIKLKPDYPQAWNTKGDVLTPF